MSYLNEIFKRFVDGKCTTEELNVLLRHFELDQYSDELDTLVAQELEKEVEEQDFPIGLEEIVEHNRMALRSRNRKIQSEKTIIRSLKYLLPLAGMVLLVSTIVLYFHSPSPVVTEVVEQHDVSPGTNRAFITLADGRTIELNEQKNGVVINDGAIEYNDGNEIVQAGEVQYAVLTTPRAGHYRIQLPDGTHVSLNAESSLRYPLEFTGETRKVELTGEAYFEVAKSIDTKGELIPFVVESANQWIEVLGTRFNVSGYLDEEVMQTTLVEGSVRVFTESTIDGQLLLPGELASVRDGRIEVRPADIESITAWTNGDFIFNQEDLHSVMKKIARWYDVEIVYTHQLNDIQFSGAISRSRNLSAVLKMMEMTGEVMFKIEGGRVVVMG